MMKIWKHSFQGLRCYGRFQKTIGKYLNSLKKLPKQGTLFSHPMTERTSYGVWLGSTLPAVWNPASPYGLFAKSVFLSGAMFSSFTRMKSSRSCRTGVSWLPMLIRCIFVLLFLWDLPGNKCQKIHVIGTSELFDVGNWHVPEIMSSFKSKKEGLNLPWKLKAKIASNQSKTHVHPTDLSYLVGMVISSLKLWSLNVWASTGVHDQSKPS